MILPLILPMIPGPPMTHRTSAMLHLQKKAKNSGTFFPMQQCRLYSPLCIRLHHHFENPAIFSSDYPKNEVIRISSEHFPYVQKQGQSVCWLLSKNNCKQDLLHHNSCIIDSQQKPKIHCLHPISSQCQRHYLSKPLPSPDLLSAKNFFRWETDNGRPSAGNYFSAYSRRFYTATHWGYN